MALVPMKFDNSKSSNSITVTPTTNSYYTINSAKSFSIGDAAHCLTIDVNCTTPDDADWREIATLSVTAKEDLFINGIAYNGTNNPHGISFRVGGNKLYAFTGITGGRYRAQIMFATS